MGVYNTATNTWEHDTAYTYDSMSRLATLASLGKSATYTRINSSNRLSNVAFANNVGAPNIGYTYDSQLRLAGKGGNSRYLTDKDEVGSQNYDFESNSHYYVYDAQGQLNQEVKGIMSANGPVGTETNFSYDQIGNVLSGSLTYNNVNQPSNLVYDADGNMTKNGSTLYTYDAENRLKTMGTSGNYKEFFYDYAGRCFKRQTVRKTTTTSVTVNEYLIYDKTKIIAVLNGSASAITEKYTWQPPTSGDADVLLWDATSVYLTDCNKNIVKRYYFNIDAWQNLVDTYSYTPFGTLTSGSATPFRFGFSSEESYNGLYLYLYRAYNPTLKRWLTRDPIEENGGVNLYNFVGNNPISMWDRLGQWSALSIVSGILGVISGIGIIGLITASTPAIAAVALVATGVMVIGFGLSEIIEGFTDRNYGVEYSESIASTMGFEPAYGRYTYRGIEFVSTVFSFKGSLKNLKIIFKGERYIEHTIDYVRWYPSTGFITEIQSTYHAYEKVSWSLRVYYCSELLIDGYGIKEDVTNSNDAIGVTVSPDIELERMRVNREWEESLSK